MSESQESKPFLRRYWEGYKEFWGERFSFIDNYSRFLDPSKPLPHWDSSVVEEFIASDPVHGPTLLKTTRQAAKFGAVGAAIGAASTAGLAWKWSKSPHVWRSTSFVWHALWHTHGRPRISVYFTNCSHNKAIFLSAALSLAFGAVVGGTFGLEVSSHWYQLYRLDTNASQVKFYEWLQKRA
ncbi:succinate dehydrogenase [Orobanche hederae]